MARIIHRKDPAGIEKPIVYNVPNGTNVLDWLNETFSDQSELCGDLACSFVLNNRVIFSNDDEIIDESKLDFTLWGYDDLVIVNRPAGVTAVVAIVIAVVSVAVAVLTYLALSDLPGAEGTASTSPNNKLNAAQNELRPGEGIPECFGSAVAYPDFIQPSYYYYEDNLKIVVGLFCISVGEVDVSEIRVGETDINNIPRSSGTVFLPGTEPDAEYLRIHRQASTVDGQVAIAPDDESVVRNSVSTTVTNSGSLTEVTIDSEIADDLGLALGGYIFVDGVPNISALSYEILSITGDAVTQTITFLGSGIGTPGTYSCTIGRGAEPVAGAIGPNDSLDYWIGFFDVPGDDVDEVRIHWQMPNGISTDSSGKLTVEVYFEIQEYDSNDLPLGPVYSKTETISGNSQDPQFITTAFSSSEFPGMSRTRYRVRCRRLTESQPDNSRDQVKIEAFESVTPYDNYNFGDVTLLLVERKATTFSPDQSGQKINVDYTRKLPTYNRVTGEYDENTLTATDSFADAAAYTLISAGGEDVDDVNLEELYEIYDGLSDSQLGEFSFSFSDAELSMGERIESICNVARCVGYHDGKQWRFTREESKPVRSAMFNRRSLAGNDAKQVWTPQRDDDSDSVRIIYVDPDSNSEVYIERKFDLNTNTIIEDEVGSVVKEIKLAGCRNELQATNRADLEIRRLAYQRRGVTDTTYREALELELLDRVGWVDINDVAVFDGEIIGIDGDNYDTTERFIPEDGESYVVYITDNEGYPSNTVTCTARSDTEFGFTASGISGAYVAASTENIGSRYLIANANDLVASDFTLKSRTPSDDGTVEIELIEYREEMFEND